MPHPHAEIAKQYIDMYDTHVVITRNLNLHWYVDSYPNWDEVNTYKLVPKKWAELNVKHLNGVEVEWQVEIGHCHWRWDIVPECVTEFVEHIKCRLKEEPVKSPKPKEGEYWIVYDSYRDETYPIQYSLDCFCDQTIKPLYQLVKKED